MSSLLRICVSRTLQHSVGPFQLGGSKIALSTGKLNPQSRLTIRSFACQRRTPVFSENVILCQVQRTFKTTARNDLPIPPILWMVAKPIVKVFSMLTGRSLRGWWSRLSAQEKKHIFNKSKGKVAVIAGVGGIASVVYYVAHLQETPVTHRRRYIAFTPSQFEKISQFERDMILDNCKDSILPVNHPLYNRVGRVVKRISSANADLDFMANQDWTIIVIKSPEQNAFVLPTGEIFVFTGLFDMVTNDDQLAVVIGHEMSHALLSHGAERVSYAQFVDVIVIIALAAIWFFMPSDGIAAVTHYFYQKVIELLLNLPYERKLETEADVVGLELMAKACYDVRESSHFWEIMNYRSEVAREDGEVEMPQWLSTHPSHQNRSQYLKTLLPDAINTRDICKCPPLNSKNPADGIALLKKIVNEVQLKST